MPPTATTQLLASLERDPGARALRFDARPAFAGRVAVLPAAFNPPTLAHLHLLQLAAREPGVDSAAALLSTRNVDKGLHGATLPQRIDMLLALAESHPIAVLATNRARLADQSHALQASFPGVDFEFVVGYDTLVRLFDERYYDDMGADLAAFFERHRLIATNRAHHSTAEVERFIRDDPLAATHAARILVRTLDDEPASYSSTASRNHAAVGHDLPQLPPPVAAYIRTHNLYRDGGGEVL